MDVTSITSFRRATTRADLTLAPGEVVMAGGTWLMSEPQPQTAGFVDITTMGWDDLEVTEHGLTIGATCTIAALVAFAPRAPLDWRAARVFPDAANALLASFKVWNTATVGGNVCRSFAAAAMVSLAAGLDGTVTLWRQDGGERSIPVADFVTGNGTNVLELGEVLRSIHLPAYALRSRMTLRKIALAELGRSGAVVTGRVDLDGSATFVVTAATLTPYVLRYPALPTAAALAADIGAAPDFYSDPLGAADWRRGVSVVLAEDIRAELEAGA